MERLSGIGVSPGVVVGRAVILTQRTEVMRFPIPPDRVEREVEALQRAREASKQQLHDLRTRLSQGRGGELAAVFDAQILMLDDPMLVGRASEIVRGERVNAAWAVHRAYEEVDQLFRSMEDPYLREREHGKNAIWVASDLLSGASSSSAAPGPPRRAGDGPDGHDAPAKK